MPPIPRPGLEPSPPRVLFLDDDPRRAEIFLAENPQAVWVETVAECLEKLKSEWDEVHLDHDLGGEQYVGQEREDCGMEVVRWLSLTPQPHLTRTRFLIHSHNPGAANLMGMQMMVNGYRVEVRPFGSKEPVHTSDRFQSGPAGLPNPIRVLLSNLRDSLRWLLTPKRGSASAEVREHLQALRERATQAEESGPKGDSPAAPVPE